MPEPKAPYKLVIKLSSARPDAIGEALAQLKRMTGDVDLNGETSATLTIECYKEAPLTNVREHFEIWLYGYKIAMDCEVTTKAPGVRPETVIALRANKETPMDREWQDFADKNNASISGTLFGKKIDVTPGESAMEWLEAREQD